MTPRKSRRLRAIISKPEYYNSRLGQTAELFGYWTALNLIARKHVDAKISYWNDCLQQTDKMRKTLFARMCWYTKKQESFWNESFDYET